MAAFIASLSSSSLSSAGSIHLQQAVVAFNSQVSLPNAIAVIFALASPNPTQKVLSGMIKDQIFANLMDSSSHANRACLLLVVAPHSSSSWLSVVPSTSLGLHLKSNAYEYWMAISGGLGLDTSGRSMCPFCPDTSLDPLGHRCDMQAWGGDVVIRHNRSQMRSLTSVVVPT